VIALIQRVNWARINIGDKPHADIKLGVLVFIGVEKADTDSIANKLLDKILAYRVFADLEGRMNLNLKDVEGDLMLVSQFTLAADTNSGLRPSFSTAMEPIVAEEIYDRLVETAKSKHTIVRSGQFAADMQIALENNGPVSFILSS